MIKFKPLAILSLIIGLQACSQPLPLPKQAADAICNCPTTKKISELYEGIKKNSPFDQQKISAANQQIDSLQAHIADCMDEKLIKQLDALKEGKEEEDFLTKFDSTLSKQCPDIAKLVNLGQE